MTTTLDQPDTITAPAAPALPTQAPTEDEQALFDSIFKNDNDEETDDDQSDDTGDHERFSHYVSKADIVRSATQGVSVYALCGKKWRPRKNPNQFPVCPECKKAHESLRDA